MKLKTKMANQLKGERQGQGRIFLSALMAVVVVLAVTSLQTVGAKKDGGAGVDLRITVNAQTVYLSCNAGGAPARGSQPGGQQRRQHPNAEEACAKLDEINGDLNQIELAGLPCTREMDPQSVTITGTYKGKAVNYNQGFGNPCILKGAGGALFDIGTLED